jgi:lipopolysaccharide export system protein LptA
MTRAVIAGIAVAVLATLAAGRAGAQAIDLSQGGAVEVTSRGGFEWRENEQLVIATGDARAVRGDVTVLADRLIAHYRKKGTGPGETPAATPAAPTPASGTAATTAAATPANAAGDPDSGGNEVYRLEADSHVRIFTPTDFAQGDHATYDIDQAVLLMTGHDLKLITPQQVMTARDSMEYWSQRHIAVGRGNAVVVTSDGRRLAGDVLVGYTTDPNDPVDRAQSAAAKPVDPSKPQDPLLSSGKLKRVEAFGNVEVRTQTDIVRGERGVYVPDTGIARVVGHVRVTHGDNQINGPAADVNMKTGIAHMLSGPSQRVEGLIMPNNAQTQSVLGMPAKPAAPPPGALPPASKPAAP